ncbi:MAG: bifunctional diguanylate cyclase/phosphodiesterase [Alteromonas sp.]|uniref:putative bifunctional diguanylate cyclase/phosphodiesterase n=1 Tax=Alteromonas sp. RW2A1 TaxID=1917158 RepID=UPI0009037645|nr:bifunctional diguanylate cyclase/phosphodiesterase [Alteromonas sp. RW2A1]APE04430.1 hypothetical protein BM528_00450 [Alteromonas sp. RW2A1]MAI66000.1 bifunctional diguanylate cyclase/phosphodiesterase [Alteromonas sp.]
MTDRLTGLASRKSFFEQAASLTTPDVPYTIICMKIARFKQVNDGLGDELGDKVIVQIAKRLQQTFPNAALLGRMAGGNFALLFYNLSENEVEHQITRLRDFAERPILLRREVIVLSVNIGVAESCSHFDDIADAIHAAEVALHNALSSRVKFSFFDTQMIADARASHQLENALRVSLTTQATELHTAVQSEEFFLVFQPIVNAKSKQVSAFEALLRWRHPKKGVISPTVFIPIAEQIGVMDLLGSWVIGRACTLAAAWPETSQHQSPRISVNLSPSQLQNRALIYQTVKRALDKSGLNPNRLNLEITESQEISSGMIETISQLRTLGCSVALDDFGTGYSSLMELNNIPIDYVKLDRSFIASIGGKDEKQERKALNMIRAVVSLVDVFNLVPIVEGVETQYQLSTCLDAGVTFIQGFYFSRPLEENNVATYLQTNSSE